MSHLPVVGAAGADRVGNGLGRKRPLPAPSPHAPLPNPNPKEIKCPSFGGKLSGVGAAPGVSSSLWNMVSSSGMRVGQYMADGSSPLYITSLTLADSTESKRTVDSNVRSSEESPATTKEEEPSPVRTNGHCFASTSESETETSLRVSNKEGDPHFSAEKAVRPEPLSEATCSKSDSGSTSQTGLSLLHNTYTSDEQESASGVSTRSEPAVPVPSAPQVEALVATAEATAETPVDPVDLKGMHQELNQILTSLLVEETVAKSSSKPTQGPCVVTTSEALVQCESAIHDTLPSKKASPATTPAPVPAPTAVIVNSVGGLVATEQSQHRPHSPIESPPSSPDLLPTPPDIQSSIGENQGNEVGKEVVEKEKETAEEGVEEEHGTGKGPSVAELEPPSVFSAPASPNKESRVGKGKHKVDMREPEPRTPSGLLTIEVPKRAYKIAKGSLTEGADREVLAALLPFYNSDTGATDTDNAEHSDSASSSFESPRHRPDSMGFGDVPSPLHIGVKPGDEHPVNIPGWDLNPESEKKLPEGVFDKAQNISTEAILRHEMQCNQVSPAFDETAARLSRENRQGSFDSGQFGFPLAKRPSQTNFVSHLSTLGEDIKMNRVFANDGHLGPTGLTPQYDLGTPLLSSQISSDSITTPAKSVGRMGYGFGDGAGELADILERPGNEKHSHLDDSEGDASPVVSSQALITFPLSVGGVPLPPSHTSPAAPVIVGSSNCTPSVAVPPPEELPGRFTSPAPSSSPPPPPGLELDALTTSQGVEHHTVKQFYPADAKGPPPSQKDKHCDESHTRLGPDFQVALPTLRRRPILMKKSFNPRLEPLHVWSPSSDDSEGKPPNAFSGQGDSSYELARKHLENLIAKEHGSDANLVFELSAMLDKELENQQQFHGLDAKSQECQKRGPRWGSQSERAFVRGIYACRRNFPRLKKRFLPDKPVKEVVQHFYSNFKLSSRYKHWKKTPDLLVGRRIKKNFGSMGVFYGTITKYFSAQQTKGRRELFHIEYDDGDVEDLYRHELDNLLLPKESTAEDDPP
eukprot:CAMPEP_0117749326 /NCGR_PEP_ID=MMETSP0947-20121206/9664_1 /TAXON_ID=44440 /ORGANISM="Chattonella subsalsa, Strain CCMP2191" /LENGTH=1035 /DNA_ID=CAMNT_0005567197 /DNA_START=84 /DNA_END=3191 /DNA_ORIENTATION=-